MNRDSAASMKLLGHGAKLHTKFYFHELSGVSKLNGEYYDEYLGNFTAVWKLFYDMNHWSEGRGFQLLTKKQKLKNLLILSL